MPNPSPSISLEACGKLLGAAQSACAASPQVAGSSTPNWDALANSFASLSAALAWGAFLLAVISVLAAVGIGSYVLRQSRKFARRVARQEAQVRVDEWLREKAPNIIGQYVQDLSPASEAQRREDAADQIGNEIG
jgi:hypothetical protein